MRPAEPQATQHGHRAKKSHPHGHVMDWTKRLHRWSTFSPLLSVRHDATSPPTLSKSDTITDTIRWRRCLSTSTSSSRCCCSSWCGWCVCTARTRRPGWCPTVTQSTGTAPTSGTQWVCVELVVVLRDSKCNSCTSDGAHYYYYCYYYLGTRCSLHSLFVVVLWHSPTNKSTNKPTDKPTNKPANKPTNKPTPPSHSKFGHQKMCFWGAQKLKNYKFPHMLIICSPHSNSCFEAFVFFSLGWSHCLYQSEN